MKHCTCSYLVRVRGLVNTKDIYHDSWCDFKINPNSMIVKIRKEAGVWTLMLDNCKATVESLERVFEVLKYLKLN